MAQARKGIVLSKAVGGAGYGAEYEVPRVGGGHYECIQEKIVVSI